MQKDKAEIEEGITQNLETTNNGLPNYTKLAKVILLKENWSAENGLLKFFVSAEYSLILQVL